MTNKKILIVTYYWPPSGGVGVQRWMHYAIELKKQGWEPIVYTPENPQFELKDQSLLEKVRDIRTVKTKIWEPFRLFHWISGGKNKGQVTQGLVLEKEKTSFKDRLFIWIRGNLIIPDPRKYWVKPSIEFLKGFILKEEIEVVITTGPPHSIHLIGLGVKRKLNVKWYADFRDPWSKWDVLNKLKSGKLAKRRHSMLEKKVLHAADRVMTVTPELVKAFNELGNRNDSFLLYNGVSFKLQAPKERGDILNIGHFGMLNELRNAPELWKVLNEFAKTNEIRLRLGGIVSDQVKKEIDGKQELAGRTNYLGYLDQAEVLTEYEKSDVLLLLQNNSENADNLLPLKFFEYLAASRFVLVIGPRDNQLAKLAEGLSTFKVVQPNDLEGMREAMSYFQDSRSDFHETRELFERFTHEHQVKDLIKLLSDG